jgi:hypothetical protein
MESNVIPYSTQNFTKFTVYTDGDDDEELPPKVRYAPIPQDGDDSDYDPE